MKNFTTTALLLLFSYFNSFSQAPFTTLVQEPRLLEKVDNNFIPTYDKVTDTVSISNFFSRLDADSTLTDSVSTFIESKKNEVDFFKNNTLALSLLDEGESRLSISSQVIHYKLYVADPKENNKYRINRYNIPLLLISKLSTSYDTINASGSIDVLDYEAAPISLRIMPSWETRFNTYTDVIYYGFYTDIRGLNIYDPESSNYDIEVIGSGGIGLTYQGVGQAGIYNSNGEYAEGKYSISLILQAATGKKEIISKLFDTDKNFVTSFQAFFLFKVDDDSKLNIKIGYQRFFQETIAGTKSNFSIAIGI